MIIWVVVIVCSVIAIGCNVAVGVLQAKDHHEKTGRWI